MSVQASKRKSNKDELTLVDIYVPVILNGAELEETRHERELITVEKLYGQYLKPGRIDVKPPYQRHEAWSMKLESAFISSICMGAMSIPPIYLCKKTSHKNCRNTWTVDGRQRVTAIDNFMNDRFKIDLFYVFSDGENHVKQKRKMLWSEIEASEECFGIREKFLNHEFPVITYDNMPLENQRKIFLAYNHGVPLSAEEMLYCNHFLSRRVLSHLFEVIFTDLAGHCTEGIRIRKRFADIKLMHELLMLCGNVDFNQPPGPTGLRAKDREPSASFMHTTLEEMNFNYDDNVLKSHLVQLNIQGKIPTLRNLTALMNDIFTLDRKLGRVNEHGKTLNYVHARNVTDVLGVLYKMIHEDRTTVAYLQENQGSLIKALHRYYKDKPGVYANQSTSDLPVMTAKYNLLESKLKRSKLI